VQKGNLSEDMARKKDRVGKLSISLPASLIKEITTECEKTGLSVSRSITNILKRYYEESPYTGGEMIDYDILSEKILKSNTFKQIIREEVRMAIIETLQSIEVKA
jgi:hypothetical protein